ncbi:hypothetical protein E6O75_ATG01782 [Venturia nashicola]|uniref:Uncharacterized protein n=1 Tax=Venturia nashicola TaxID=86259 RepID=A0A4Z1NYP2_9PEZI|nr:hypothetical protein E6O75_ATG01782 [Venturia nashicola]
MAASATGVYADETTGMPENASLMGDAWDVNNRHQWPAYLKTQESEVYMKAMASHNFQNHDQSHAQNTRAAEPPGSILSRLKQNKQSRTKLKDEHKDIHSARNRKPSKLLKQLEGGICSHATHQASTHVAHHHNDAHDDEEEEEEEGNSQSTNSHSHLSPDILTLHDLSGLPKTLAPTPDPDEDSYRCSNYIPQPANNNNPFYRRPIPGGPLVGAHPTISLMNGGSQVFKLYKWKPFDPYPTTEPTERCTRRLRDSVSASSSSSSGSSFLEGDENVVLLPCLAHQILNAAPFNLAIPIKEACAIGVCGVCFRRESKPQGNLNNTGQPTTIKPSWDCVCQDYPSLISGEAMCATQVEQYTFEVQTRAQLCADYRRQIYRLDPRKPNKKNWYKKAPPPMRYINTTYWRHKNPPDSLPPWPPAAAHPRNERDWYPIPRCPCGRPARHNRRGEANRIRSCAICTQIHGDPPSDVANPRPMTVETNAGIHIGRGVKVPEKTFQAGPYTGKSYGTEGWVRR